MSFVGDIIICILFLGLARFAILEIRYVAKSFRIHCIEENLEEVQKLKPINKYDTLTIIPLTIIIVYCGTGSNCMPAFTWF